MAARAVGGLARARVARFSLLRYRPGDRHGVLWASTRNIGDEIQTLAVIDMLRRCGVDRYGLIDRERLRAYSGPPLTLVMNGWFTHSPAQFPPRGHVKPVYIGFHCTPSMVGAVVVRNAKHFRAHQPIGCRDDFTREALERVGVEAYLSGCPSLTFEPHERKDGGVYCINTHHEAPPSPFEGTLLERVGLERLGLERGDVEHISHRLDPRLINRPERRLELARELLERYRAAKLIVTSRLHVALPSRAFHTDVAFINARYDDEPRFMVLHDVLNGSAEGPLSPEQVKTDRVAVARHRDGLMEALRRAL